MRFDQLMSSHSVGLFFAFFAAGIFLWVLFNYVYLWLTPYDEYADIKAGKMAPAIALVGAEVGFMLPLASASYVSNGSLYAFAAWGVLAGAVQLGAFKLMYWCYPASIEADNRAVATVFAGASVCIGLLNAVSMIP